MKFDVCLMNPPYDGNLHLKFLEKAIQISDYTVNISPVRWIQDPLVKYKRNTDYSKFENSISKYIKSLDIYTGPECNKLFNINQRVSLGIYVCDEVGGFDYKSLSESEFLNKIIDKYPNDLGNIIEYNKIDGIRVKLRSIIGDPLGTISAKCGVSLKEEPIIDGKLKNGDDWTTLSSMLRGKANIPYSVKFDTIDEAQNFINSFKTKFMIYLYDQIFYDQHVFFKVVPYMNDYTEPWTDERFFKYFGISKEKQNYILNYIK